MPGWDFGPVDQEAAISICGCKSIGPTGVLSTHSMLKNYML